MWRLISSVLFSGYGFVTHNFFLYERYALNCKTWSVFNWWPSGQSSHGMRHGKLKRALSFETFLVLGTDCVVLYCFLLIIAIKLKCLCEQGNLCWMPPGYPPWVSLEFILGVRWSSTPKDIMDPRYGGVLHEQFHSVYVMKGVWSLFTHSILNKIHHVRPAQLWL